MESPAVDVKSLSISEADIVIATKAALGPNAILESFDSKLLDEPGVGFLAVHFLLSVHVREAPGKPIQTVEMFAKMFPPNSDVCLTLRVFPTESAFYNKLFGPLESAARSPDGSDGPKWCAKCYLAREDLIILENVVEQGYKSNGDWIQQPLTLEHYRQICIALARCHAAGLALAQKHGKRDIALELCPELKTDIFYNNDYKLGGVNCRNAAADSLVAILSHMLEPSERHRLRELQEKLWFISNNSPKMVEDAKVGPVVPCHGDCHPDNYLMKCNSEGKPVEALILDMQLARFNVPAMDLSFLLYVSASREFRDAHWDQLFRFYYDCLKSETARSGGNLEAILSYEDLLAGAERIKTPLLVMTAMYASVLYAPRPEMQKIMCSPFDYQRFILHARAGECVRWFLTRPLYRERVEDLLRLLLEI